MDGHESEVREFIDWIYGRERDETHGAVARFVQAHERTRPSLGSGQPARWQTFDALRTHAAHTGPDATSAQINAAIAAFRAR